MMPLPLLTLVLSLVAATANAKQNEEKQSGRVEPPYSTAIVFNQAMSDPGLAGYEMLAMRLDILPSGVDPAPHRHDADLFVYVLEGSIEVELAEKKVTYAQGAMFHEPRNVLHSLLRNTSKDKPASILALFVIKDGREPLVPAE